MIPLRAYIRLLARYLRPLRARVVQLSVLLFVGIALQLVNPQLVRIFLDRAVGGGDQSELIPLAVWFMIIAIAHQGIAVLSTYIAEDVGWRATNEMRDELAAHVLDLDMGFHKQHTAGELIERIDGDVTALSNFFSAFAIRVIANLVLVIGVLVFIWRENLWVGFGLALFSVIALAGMIAMQTVAVGWWTAVRARRAEFFGFVGEQLDGVEDIRANGGAPFMLYRFTKMIRAWRPAEIRGRYGFSVLWGASITTYVVGTALVFWLGSVFFGRGDLTLGSVYLIFHYTEMTRHPMEQIRTQMEDFQKAGAGISRVEGLFAHESALPRSGTSRLPAGPLSVRFDGVEFSYDDRGERDGGSTGRVLHGVSFEIAAGRIVGVLGRSGSGKTTLARLLTRLYDPGSGEIYVGGMKAHQTDVVNLRQHVGMVSQDVQLFRATIRDNLTFYDDSITDDQLVAVLNALGLEAWLRRLPGGLDTHLEAGGGGLSAGQAQLLAFTRIFLKNPGLVILDEASSRLDPATEALIERAVRRLLENRTGFIIAHRLATVTQADDILILEDGVVVEFGERAALAADPESRFSGLLKTGLDEVLA